MKNEMDQEKLLEYMKKGRDRREVLADIIEQNRPIKTLEQIEKQAIKDADARLEELKKTVPTFKKVRMVSVDEQYFCKMMAMELYKLDEEQAEEYVEAYVNRLNLGKPEEV